MENDSLDLSSLSEKERSYRLSLAQTLFSLERTFLAWVRTGLTGLALGIAISQFIIFKNISDGQTGHRVGQGLVLWSISVFLFSLICYRRNYFKISRGKSIRELSFSGLTIITVSLIVITSILFWLVVK